MDFIKRINTFSFVKVLLSIIEILMMMHCFLLVSEIYAGTKIIMYNIYHYDNNKVCTYVYV